MPVKRRTAAFLLGALSVAGFAPFHLFFLPILAIAGLNHLWSENEDGAWTGFSFGMGLFLFGVSWVYVSLHDFGGMPLPVAVLSTLLFCAFLSIYFAICGKLQEKFRAGPLLKAVLVIPAMLALCDWARGWLFTGFPWLAFGYSQTDYSPLSGFAPLFGVYGVSLVTAICGGLVYLLSKPLLRKRAGILLIILVLSGYGLKGIDWTSPTGEPVTVSLVQGNIPQDRKWSDTALEDTLDVYMTLVLSSKARLIILPETAIPMFIDEVPKEYLEMFRIHGRKNRGDVVAGLPEQLTNHEQTYYNSVFNFGASPAQVYRKSHLVPFGEYLPLAPLFGWLLDLMHIPMSDFSSGSENQKPMKAAGQRLAIDICYEDVFGEEVIRQLPEATMLVNVSDDAWFGDSVAPRQHMQISQMRAMETGRMMLRSTNTGMTAVIDPHGKVLSALPEFREATLNWTAQGYSGTTPYVRWGNHAFLVVAFVMLAAASITSKIRDF